MAFDAYIKFIKPGLNGQVVLDKKKYDVEGDAEGHSGWIDMSEYSFSGTMAVTQARSAGVGAATTGKGKLEPFTFKKFVDATSMHLAFHAAAGTLFQLIIVQLFASQATEAGTEHKPEGFLTIKIKGAVITSCKFSAGGGDDLPAEDVSITYGSIEYVYKSFKVSNVETGAIEAGPVKRFQWNTVSNTGSKG